jgi:hypothetical protein
MTEADQMHRILLFVLGGAAYTAAAPRVSTRADDACALLTPALIAKATSLVVGNPTPGKPIPGVLARCTWEGSNATRVIVTLADAKHMDLTVRATEQSGGAAVTGIGTKAVGSKGAPAFGGGYIVSVLDAKGGFGVSILGPGGTRDGAIALAKLVESRR